MNKYTILAGCGWYFLYKFYNKKIYKDKKKSQDLVSLTNGSLMLGFSLYQIYFRLYLSISNIVCVHYFYIVLYDFILEAAQKK